MNLITSPTILFFALLSLTTAITLNKHHPNLEARNHISSYTSTPSSESLIALNKKDIKALSHPLNPLPDVTDQVPRTQINILTYNFFLRPPTIQDDDHDDYKDQRVEEFIKLFPNYDIICFEEVFAIMSKRRSHLIEAGKQAGFQYQTNSPSPSSGFLADGGLLLLSRFPILATDFQAFPKGEDIEGLVNKGIIYAKIQVKDDVAHMFQTHQLADTSINHRNKRGKGFVVWRDFMKKCFKENNYREGEIILLLGDFNVKGNGPKLTADELAGHPVVTLYPDLVENNDGISEYEAMLAILSENKKDDIEDLLLKKFGEHPSTYSGSIYGGSSQQALDYIFKFTPKSMLEEIEEEGSEEEDKGGKLSIVDDSVKVENFNVEGQPFKQLSDHYGVMVALDYVEGNN